MANLNRMIRVGLPEKVTFEQRAKGFKEVGPEDIWRKECSDGSNSMCRGPVAGSVPGLSQGPQGYQHGWRR